MSTPQRPLLVPFHEGRAKTPIARPRNLTRSAFHVAAGLTSLALIRLLPGRGWLFAAAAAFAASAWTMEIARRKSPAVNARLMRIFGPVAHAHEGHRTNSSTWYVTALAILALVAPMRGAELGVLVLGVADPAAGVVGRRFGRVRLAAARTLEGTLAFVGVGFLAGLGWLLATGASLSPAIALAIIAAVVGAAAELVSSRRFDDNFAIPVSIAGSVALALPHLLP